MHDDFQIESFKYLCATILYFIVMRVVGVTRGSVVNKKFIQGLTGRILQYWGL